MVRKETLLSLLLGCVVGVAATAVVAFALPHGGGTISSSDCPLEFGLSSLNTSYGWFYWIDWQKAEPGPLEGYNVTFFALSAPDAQGNQQRVVDQTGPLANLVGSTGNFSFEDRGSQVGMLDNGGDYFWTREFHHIEVSRLGRIVGGTLGCA